ncbi:unnamed protein product [Caenorhabditis sp. 36 PRJEB53466]|nr:unnamed protein product [Caenorhabditis sp. 36 PRJEB53466]
MSKFEDDDVDKSMLEQKDEPTAKFLHKIAENGKERGLPDCVVAFYEEKAWQATISDEKYKSCEKCGMPPPPPIDSIEKLGPHEKCRLCGEMNKNPIGIESELPKNAEILKKKEEKRRSLKRSADEFKMPKMCENRPRGR